MFLLCDTIDFYILFPTARAQSLLDSLLSIPGVLTRLELALSMGGSRMEKNRNVLSSGSKMSPAMGSGNCAVTNMEEHGNSTIGDNTDFDDDNRESSDDY